MPALWHSLTPEALAQELQATLKVGLTEHEAARRLGLYGHNELPEVPPSSPLTLFLRQFSSLVIWVLIGAAVISGLLADWVDTAAILAIVFLNALLGFVQEFRAERSLAALKKLSTTTARVVRDGSVRSIPSRELVPGDLVLVEAGDHVPADARLVRVFALRTQEAALTGESTPVDKTAKVLADKTEVAIADRRNMVFLGTNVTAGNGRAVVVATGTRTELGRIATLMQRTSPEPTPLQRRLEQLGYVLLYLTFGVVTLVFVLGLLRG
ncbi:MAG: HAD-IC family P-type ATPase, partial [Nitrospiraceae bacterium]